MEEKDRKKINSIKNSRVFYHYFKYGKKYKWPYFFMAISFIIGDLLMFILNPVYYKDIINSMNKEERRRPSIIGGPRRKRIAAGCGLSVQEVNMLLKQFAQTKKMMKSFKGMVFGKKKGFKLPFMR